MKKWIQFCLRLLLFNFSILLFSSESISSSLFPYFSIEKNIIKPEHRFVSNHGDEMTLKPVNMATLGLSFQKKNFFASISAVAPWCPTGSEFLPGINFNVGFTKKKIYIYSGFFSALKKYKPPNRYELSSPIYAGIKSTHNIKYFNLEYGFQISRGKFTEFLQKHTYYSYSVLTKVHYSLKKWIHPFVSLTAEKLSFADHISFNLGIGVTFFKVFPSTHATPKIIHPPLVIVQSPVVVKKPNIYLYPTKLRMIKVHIKPNVKILKSIPEYKKGWDITAYPDGTITGTPGYLFYEAIVQIKTPENGWCVSSSEIIPFFKSTLKNYGFKNNEIADFLDYWQNHLPRSKFYAIHPVINGDLDLICPLNIKPAPDHILRAWFIFRPLSAKISLNEPHIPPFKRDGFVVTEWGGIIKE